MTLFHMEKSRSRTKWYGGYFEVLFGNLSTMGNLPDLGISRPRKLLHKTRRQSTEKMK